MTPKNPQTDTRPPRITAVVSAKREGGSPHTDETTYAHERSRFTTASRACRAAMHRPVARGRLRLLGPQPPAVLCCLDSALMGDGRGR
jgi:hypothetical protein